MATIDPMQQEAMRRVQAMQSRVMPQRQRANKSSLPENNEVKHQEPLQKQQEPEMPPIKELFDQSQNSTKSSLDALFKDKEQNLILMLILLLAGDGADPTLLLALMYLLI